MYQANKHFQIYYKWSKILGVFSSKKEHRGLWCMNAAGPELRASHWSVLLLHSGVYLSYFDVMRVVYIASNICNCIVMSFYLCIMEEIKRSRDQKIKWRSDVGIRKKYIFQRCWTFLIGCWNDTEHWLFYIKAH